MAKVIVQKWLETERGWGTRPDGCSLHLTDADRAAFIKAYWQAMPDAVPDEYSRPDGTPYLATVSAAWMRKLKRSKNGVWGPKEPPGTGGTDGYRRLN